MGNYTLFLLFEILGEAGKQEILQQKCSENSRSQNRLPNRYFPKIDVGCPCSVEEETFETPVQCVDLLLERVTFFSFGKLVSISHVD